MVYYEIIYRERVCDPTSTERYRDIVYARLTSKEELDELVKKYSINFITEGYAAYEPGFILKTHNINTFIDEYDLAFRAKYCNNNLLD